MLEWGVWGWGSLIKHTGKVPIFFNDLDDGKLAP